MTSPAWKSYEEVTQHLLNEFAEHFGLERVEGKQKLVGQRSGRKIEIDAKGVRFGDCGFLIVECKKYKDRVDSEKLEALAYRIMDAGAEGGIIVSPVDVQSGAQKIASSENIMRVQLNADATIDSYLLRFLNQVMAGIHQKIPFTERAECTVERKPVKES